MIPDEEIKKNDASDDPNKSEAANEEKRKPDENLIESASTKIEKKPTGLTFDHYLAGGSIGFSIAIILTVATEWLLEQAGVESNISIKLMISLFPSFIGGFVAAFLFTSKSRRNYLKDGVKMAIGGIIITYIYTMLLQVKNVGGVYIIIGFLIGGYFGGFVSKRIHEDSS